MSIYLCASLLYNICHVSLRHSLELEERTPNPDHYLPAHITTILKTNVQKFAPYKLRYINTIALIVLVAYAFLVAQNKCL